MVEEALKNLKKANEIYPEYEHELNQINQELEQALANQNKLIGSGITRKEILFNSHSHN